jgi:hypothetical protein
VKAVVPNVRAAAIACRMNVVEGEDPLAMVQDGRAHIDQVGKPIGIRALKAVSRLDEIDCVRGNVFQGPVTDVYRISGNRNT